MAIVGGDEELALLARQRPDRGGVGIDQAPRSIFESTVLAEPCSPDTASSG